MAWLVKCMSHKCKDITSGTEGWMELAGNLV